MAVGKVSRKKGGKAKKAPVGSAAISMAELTGEETVAEAPPSTNSFDRPASELAQSYHKAENNIFSMAPLSALDMYARMPFGNASLDYMSGGGAPLYNVVSFWGAESSGKSSAFYDMCAANQLMCWRCHYPEKYCKCSTAPLLKSVAILAFEGLPDTEWLRHIGIDPDRCYVTLPESAEHGFDVINNMMNYDICLAGIDSITMSSPEAESSASAEQQFMALQARAIGRFLRTARNGLNRRIRQDAPLALVLINQMRFKVGHVIGSPETRSGGSALKHTDDLLIRFGKLSLDKKNKPDALLLPASGNSLPTGAKSGVSLNKTKFFCISREDSYVRLTGNNPNFPHLKTGQLIDAVTTLKAAKLCGVIEKGAKGYYFPFLDQVFETQQELLSFVASDRQNKMLIMKMATHKAYLDSKTGKAIVPETLGDIE